MQTTGVLSIALLALSIGVSLVSIPTRQNVVCHLADLLCSPQARTLPSPSEGDANNTMQMEWALPSAQGGIWVNNSTEAKFKYDDVPLCEIRLDDWYYGKVKNIREGVQYLRTLKHKPKIGPGPGRCDRVSCAWKSAIFWCNDVSFPQALCGFLSILFRTLTSGNVGTETRNPRNPLVQSHR
jgi:hypothetical protein